jgi:hypothetical protein
MDRAGGERARLEMSAHARGPLRGSERNLIFALVEDRPTPEYDLRKRRVAQR